jgi:hypothetical protein
MNVDTGTEAAQFTVKKHINVIFVAVWVRRLLFERGVGGGGGYSCVGLDVCF